MNHEIKKELRNIISGKKQISKGNSIQSIANYLRRSKETSRNAQKGEFTKQEEIEYLTKYISDTSLWIKDLENYIYLSVSYNYK